jgi:predicted DNA-binding transcriptional regulator YafY
VEIEELTRLTYVPSTVDWTEHFEDLIGVSKKEGVMPIKIKLWVNSFTAPYVLTKPLHGSQRKISLDEDGLILELELIPNYEFYQRILGFGEAVKVLSPENVVERIVKSLTVALSHYKQKE